VSNTRHTLACAITIIGGLTCGEEGLPSNAFLLPNNRTQLLGILHLEAKVIEAGLSAPRGDSEIHTGIIQHPLGMTEGWLANSAE
jgi:hypothetical protein